MGTHPVSSMVLFVNGLPDKKQYRKYTVKTVSGPDDVATMKEIIYRRYQRLLMEGGKMPDLILMDGGLAQVHAAKDILESLYLEIPVAGLKKDDRHQTDTLIDLDEQPIPLDRHDPVYVLLNKIQEEAHRFAIEFFRKRQSKEIYASVLDAIPKIGKVTKVALLRQFKTLENIQNASDQELKSVGLRQDQIANLRVGLQKIGATGKND
jgi:excinuclease ABC subunit C